MRKFFLVLAMLATLLLCKGSDARYLDFKIILGDVENSKVDDVNAVSAKYWVRGGVGYYLLYSNVVSEFPDFVRAIRFFDEMRVWKVVIYLNSPGGSYFDGVAFSQLMIEEQSKGRIVEVRCYGLAASAAALILASGSPGYRYIAHGSFVMVHEIWVFKWFEVENVSRIEKQAETLRKLQDQMIDLLITRIKLSKEELKKRCAEETWITAEEAVEWGFADHVVGKD